MPERDRILCDEQFEKSNPVTQKAFEKDFSMRFCWSSNAIEGNTLDLDETVALLEYDMVRSGHTYTEYQEAKNLYHAIYEQMLPFGKKEISEEWIKKANGIICGTEGKYRKHSVYIGTLIEATYYPPEACRVPELMKEFLREILISSMSITEKLERIAEQHICFERIHPFRDGNGRVGRMILNQQLINQGLLPLIIKPSGSYRQAFRCYEKNKDVSLMTHILCKGELESIEKFKLLVQKRNQTKDLFQKENQLKSTAPKL